MSRTTYHPARVLATLVALALLLSGLLAAPPASAAEPPPGSTWSEAWITTVDQETLHADILRPVGLTENDKTPVILIVSPYIGDVGPSNRFYDFINGAKVFERGYSVVMVSLRGTGGSSGCLDILGPGEQADVVAAVEWAAQQKWSTGRVGMYGKSYDANTGVVGAALRPTGLAAVVAQQIAPDRYRGSYNDRVRLAQSLLYPSVTYGVGAETQWAADNEAQFIVNSVSRSADCQAGLAEHYVDDESINFWRLRDFVERAQGSPVPTFVTTGYLDAATNIGAGAVDFYNALAGPKKLWIGWWDHVRGNDTAGGRLAMGREGFFDEVMRFFDHHVKGLPLEDAPTHLDPQIAAQGSDGTWRTEEAFPPADGRELESSLLSGTYADDGRNMGSSDPSVGPGGMPVRVNTTTGHGAWTFSPPLPYEVHVAGIPSASVNLLPRVPRTNVVVNVYDVDPEGRATMITRGAALADQTGPKHVQLWPTDWTFEEGHRIGVLVSGANAEAFVHVPTQTTVGVSAGGIRLPFLTYERTSDLAGDPAVKLESYKTRAPFTVPAATIAQRTNTMFNLPGPLQPRPPLG